MLPSCGFSRPLGLTLVILGGLAACVSIPDPEHVAVAQELGSCARDAGSPYSQQGDSFEQRVSAKDPMAAVLDRASVYLGKAGLAVDAMGTDELRASGRGNLLVTVRLAEVSPSETAGLVCGQWTSLAGGGSVEPAVGVPPDEEGRRWSGSSDSPNRRLLSGLVRAMEG